MSSSLEVIHPDNYLYKAYKKSGVHAKHPTYQRLIENDSKYTEEGNRKKYEDLVKLYQQKSNVVVVNNLSIGDVREEQLYELFGRCGMIERCNLCIDRKDGLAKFGSAYIVFMGREAVDNAISYLHGLVWFGRKISVKPVEVFIDGMQFRRKLNSYEGSHHSQHSYQGGHSNYQNKRRKYY